MQSIKYNRFRIKRVYLVDSVPLPKSEGLQFSPWHVNVSAMHIRQTDLESVGPHQKDRHPLYSVVLVKHSR